MARRVPAALGLALLLVARPGQGAPPDTIPVVAPAELDAQIDAQLEAIFAELAPLAEVEVEVRAGVVHLRGQVLEVEASAKAEQIAERVEGVVAVDNGIDQIHAVDRRVRPLLDTLEARALELWALMPLLLVGLLIILAAWGIARLLGRWPRPSRRASSNAFVRDLGRQLIRAGVVMLGVVLALELVGATTLIGAVLGTAGVVGLTLGFAFKDTAENYIASLLLSVRKPFEPNDLIEVEGRTGRVVRLTSRATILLTLDGNHVRIPNAQVFRSTIVNYTRNPQRRFEFQLGVSVEADLARTQALACEIVAATPGVLSEPAPGCFVEAFGDSAMIISISGWLDQREADWFKVRSEVRRRIKLGFDEAGIEVPEPIFRVRTRALPPEPSTDARHPEAIAEPDLDVRPDVHIIEQVASERAEVDDLLRSDAPIE